MVDSGIGALQSLFHLEDFPPLVFTQVAEGRAVAIGGIEAVVDAGAASAAGTVVSEGAAQLNQGAVNDILGSVLVDIGNDTLCGKVVCDNAIDSVPHRAPVELSTGAHERDGGSLNDVVDSVFVCDELQVEGAGEQFGIVHGVVSVSVLEDRVTRENGVQIICAESPNKFAALSGANEEDPNSLCGFQVVEPKPELGIPKRGRIAAGGVAELMQQLKPKAKEPKADPNVMEVPNELLKDILGVGLTEEMCEALIAPVFGKEIKDVMFAMKFFQAAWEVVGGDVIKGIQFFFESCTLAVAFNSTVITLVPKVLAPMKATE
ncbi:hypothetical protein V6N11_025253 [Hibiscus sabdariffa]|uniref:Uncharacterized protein n=1 Tax=Hibiscus sabdariffa TaxID=183260 RepID=A0ABR2QPH6_9ROSI